MTDLPDPTDELLREPLAVINVGLRGFAESLEEQEVEVVQVDWSPPAGGDAEMIDLLEKLL
jgi:FdrA protein